MKITSMKKKRKTATTSSSPQVQPPDALNHHDHLSMDTTTPSVLDESNTIVLYPPLPPTFTPSAIQYNNTTKFHHSHPKNSYYGGSTGHSPLLSTSMENHDDDDDDDDDDLHIVTATTTTSSNTSSPTTLSDWDSHPNGILRIPTKTGTRMELFSTTNEKTVPMKRVSFTDEDTYDQEDHGTPIEATVQFRISHQKKNASPQNRSYSDDVDAAVVQSENESIPTTVTSWTTRDTTNKNNSNINGPDQCVTFENDAQEQNGHQDVVLSTDLLQCRSTIDDNCQERLVLTISDSETSERPIPVTDTKQKRDNDVVDSDFNEEGEPKPSIDAHGSTVDHVDVTAFENSPGTESSQALANINQIQHDSNTVQVEISFPDHPTALNLRGKSLLVGCMAPDVIEEESLDEQSIASNTSTSMNDQDSHSLKENRDDTFPTPMSLFDTERSNMITPKSSNVGTKRFDDDDDGTSIFVTKNKDNEYWSCQLCEIINLQGHSVDVHCNGKRHRQALERTIRRHQSSILSPIKCIVVARSPRKVLEECLAFQISIDSTARTDPRFAYITYNPLESDFSEEASSSLSWSCRLCTPMIHGLKMKDIEPHCLGKKHTIAFQNAVRQPPPPVIQFDNELTPISTYKFRKIDSWNTFSFQTLTNQNILTCDTEAADRDGDVEMANGKYSDWDSLHLPNHESDAYADIERRLSADMIRSIVADVDQTSQRDYRNLSMCSTGTYYYDAMNGEWLDDDGGTIYQSFIDEDSMILYDLNDDEHERNVDDQNFIDKLQSGLHVDDSEGMDLSMLVGEEYIDELDTNLVDFCEQLSLELDEMSNLVLGKTSVDL